MLLLHRGFKGRNVQWRGWIHTSTLNKNELRVAQRFLCPYRRQRSPPCVWRVTHFKQDLFCYYTNVSFSTVLVHWYCTGWSVSYLSKRNVFKLCFRDSFEVYLQFCILRSRVMPVWSCLIVFDTSADYTPTWHLGVSFLRNVTEASCCVMTSIFVSLP